MNTIILVTGGFDPLHSGHIAYFKAAKTLGDMLIVGLNSDEWLERKKGKAFMSWNERLCIINNLSMVDEVYTFNDDDNSAKQFIHQVRAHYPTAHLVFANGGDRTASNIPEMDIIDDNLEFVFGIGGEDKKNSSSAILDYYMYPVTKRSWGNYKILREYGQETKVKEIVVDPGCSLSMQKHSHRSEHWFVVSGIAEVYTINKSTDYDFLGIFHKHQSLHIKKDEWHQLCNPSNEPLKIIEIQYGNNCVEEDIERK